MAAPGEAANIVKPPAVYLLAASKNSLRLIDEDCCGFMTDILLSTGHSRKGFVGAGAVPEPTGRHTL